MMKKKIYSAILEIPITQYYDVEFTWKGESEPTEDDVREAYIESRTGFKFTESGSDEEHEGIEVSDIEESE